MKIPTPMGEHSGKCTELSLKQNKVIQNGVKYISEMMHIIIRLLYTQS